MVLFLVFSALVANPNNYFTPGQSRSWSTNQGKKGNRKSLSVPPPPALLVRRKQSENHATHLHAPRRNAGLVPSRACTKIPSTCRLGQLVSLRKILRFLCAMTTSPVYLPLSSSGDVSRPSISSFLHAAMNLRPPSATVSTHTSAYNAVAFHPAMPNARMSFYLGGGAG